MNTKFAKPESQATQTDMLAALAQNLNNDQLNALTKWAGQLMNLNPQIANDQKKIRQVMAQNVDLGSGVSLPGNVAARLLETIVQAAEASGHAQGR